MRPFFAAVVSTTLFHLSHSQEICRFDQTAYQTDINALDESALVNVLMKKKLGVMSAYPDSLELCMQFLGGEIVAGTMAKGDYESIANNVFSDFDIELDHIVVAFGNEGGNLRRNLAEFNKADYIVPYGIDMVLQDRDFWSNLGNPIGSTKVCIADTGYDSTHVDLPHGYVTGKSNRWYPNAKWYVDGHGHGTHVSGTVAAIGDNDVGVIGVIPDDIGGKFELLISNACDENGSCSMIGVMKAVENCVAMGAKVVSLSLGDSEYSEIYEGFYKALYEDQDILFVAAASNDGDSSYSYPASFASVMSVAAVDINKEYADFSNFNDQVEISAPGVSILSTNPGDEYGEQDGTSMATPHVAAVAGLLRMYFPQCKNHQIRNVLLFTAEELGGDKKCDDHYGYGLVRAMDAYEQLARGCGNLGWTARGGCKQLYPIPFR